MLNVNKFLNDNLARSNSSRLSPSRKTLTNGSMRKLRSSCREKNLSSSPQETFPSTDSGIFQKKRDTQKQPKVPIVKLSHLDVKTVIPEESEADLEAEIESDKKSQEIIDQSIKDISRRKTIGRSKKVVYSAPAGTFWPDLSTLSEIDEKIEKITQNEDWFGSGEHVMIKNFNSNDSVIYENSEDNYDTPNELQSFNQISDSAHNSTSVDESFYENSEIYVNESNASLNGGKPVDNQFLDSSSLLSHSSANSVGSAFSPVIPENSIKKIKEYFDLKKDLGKLTITNSDKNNNKEAENDGFYDEAWDHRLQRKLGHKTSLLRSDQSLAKNEVRNPVVKRETASSFIPVDESTYEPPWDSSQSQSHNIVNRISPLKMSFRQTEIQPITAGYSSDHLDQEIWYHPNMTRTLAEAALTNEPDGTFLVRPSGTSPNDYSLTIKFTDVLHMKIKKDKTTNHYILGEYSKPYTSIRHMIDHFTHCFVPVWDSEPVPLKYPFKRVR